MGNVWLLSMFTPKIYPQRNKTNVVYPVPRHSKRVQKHRSHKGTKEVQVVKPRKNIPIIIITIVYYDNYWFFYFVLIDFIGVIPQRFWDAPRRRQHHASCSKKTWNIFGYLLKI